MKTHTCRSASGDHFVGVLWKETLCKFEFIAEHERFSTKMARINIVILLVTSSFYHLDENPG